MKILQDRFTTYAPFGQWLIFDDGTREWDAECSQTTPILTAQLNGNLAAKKEDGTWMTVPSVEGHESVYRANNNLVGLTFVGLTSDGNVKYASGVRVYFQQQASAVVLPCQAVEFHSDKDRYVCVPPHWEMERVVAEILAWVCVGEDAGADFPADTTPRQWEWIRSPGREYLSMLVDEWMAAHDHGDHYDDLSIAEMIWPADPIPADELADRYLDGIIHNQTSLVSAMLENGQYLNWERITNLWPDPYKLDARALVAELDDQLDLDEWRNHLEITDCAAYAGVDLSGDDARQAFVATVDPRVLTDDDLGLLRDRADGLLGPRNILEWWLVDTWLHVQLDEIGEPTLSDGNNHWWGRKYSGQPIMKDGVLQRIAAKYAIRGFVQ